MNCPRCETETHADRNHCPECAWQLSAPYTGNTTGKNNGNGAAGMNKVLSFTLPMTNGATALAPETQPAANVIELAPDPYLPRPRQPHFWTDRASRALPRRWARRRRDKRPESLGSAAVAVMPKEARWATPVRLEYIEMPLLQSHFDFNAAGHESEELAAQANAPLRMRLQAGLLDALLIATAAGLFFGLFALLGGTLGLGKKDLLLYLTTSFLLSSLYFGFFSLTSTTTPGMQFTGLRTVTFEGRAPALHHRLWRAFGYMVSTGSLLLGFVWSAVDDKRLTWHDYISGTFVTDRTQF